MEFSEKQLEEIIFTSSKEQLKQRGLNKTGKFFRQVRIGNYGIADLVEITRCYYLDRLYVTVYELKKDDLTAESFFQAVRYAKGIQSWFSDRSCKYDVEIGITLIGSGVKHYGLKSNPWLYLSSLYDNINFYSYDYGRDGIIFKEEQGFCLPNEGF